MVKRGMRAAGVCLATVLMASGGAPASGAVEDHPLPTLELSAEDFTLTLTASPRGVVVGPSRHTTAAEYLIVVDHSESVDQINRLVLGLQNSDSSASVMTDSFKMRATVVESSSATRTVLRGDSGFWDRFEENSLRVEPGYYTALRATVDVTAGGESAVVTVAPPSGEIRVRYASRTLLSSSETRRGRAVLTGRLLRYAGGAPRSGDEWAAASDKRISVLCRSWRPVLVTSTRTDGSGEFTVRLRADLPSPCWARYPGGAQLGASRSRGYRLNAS
jgi:hypothetical protein